MIIECNEDERQSLFRILDAAVKTVGLAAVNEVKVWADKLNSAVSNVNEAMEHD